MKHLSALFIFLSFSISSFAYYPNYGARGYYLNKFTYGPAPRFLSYARRPGLCRYNVPVANWGPKVCNLQPNLVIGCNFYSCGGQAVVTPVCGWPLQGYYYRTIVRPCGW